MSDLSKVKKYPTRSNRNLINGHKSPSLAAFVLDHESLVSTKLVMLRKRGPGLKVDLEKLWSFSKLDGTVEIEGNNTLEASIKASGRKTRKRLENKNATKEKEIKENESEQSSEVESSCMSDEEDETVDEIAYKLNDEDATEFEKVLLSNTVSPHILKNDHDFSNSFKRF